MRQKSGGFTLVEIIIAIIIIGVFTTIPVFAYNNYSKGSRDIKRKNDLNSLQQALQQYKTMEGKYPEDSQFATTIQNYVEQIPDDPREGQPAPHGSSATFGYTYQKTVTGYRLVALLEQEAKADDGTRGPAYYILTEGGESLTVSSALPTIAARPSNSPIPSLFLSPTATPLPPTPTPTGAILVLSNVADSGFGGSLALAPDGNPMMAFIRNGELLYAKCGDKSCSSAGGVTIQSLTTAVSGTPSLTTYTSIISGSDGFPMIGYIHQLSGRNMHVYDCTNAACTTGTVRIIDANNNSGYYPDIALSNDGNPLVTYWHSGNNDLAIVKCTLSTCATGGTQAFANGANGNSFYPNIVIRSNGLPLFIYNSDTDQDLAAVRCNDNTCSQPSIDTLNFLTDQNRAISFVAAIMGNQNLPIVSYYDEVDQDLRFLRCSNANCSSLVTPVTIDSDGDTGTFSAMARGNDGFPVITYMKVNSGQTNNPVDADLKVAKCRNAGCTSVVTTTIDSGNVGMFSNIVVPSDGKPFITYYDQGNKWLKAYKCGNSSCQ